MLPKVDNKIKMTKISPSVTSTQDYSGDFTQFSHKKDRKETEREIKKYENQKEKSSLHQYDSLYFKKSLKIYSHAHIQLRLKINLENFQGIRTMYKIKSISIYQQ